MSETVRFNQTVGGPCAWRARELAGDTSWIYELNPADVAELERGLASAKRSGKAGSTLRREDFPLPRLQARIAAAWDQLENGRGIALFRGIPVERYDLEDVELLYWGIGAHFGIAIPQNTRGDLIGHVLDTGLKWGEAHDGELTRGYRTRAYLPFHNDVGDLVALLCVQKSKTGGLSSIVSTNALYNEILAASPSALDVLCRGFHYSLRGEGTGGIQQVTSFRVPVFSFYDGKLSARYVRKTIDAAARVGGVELTAEEVNALDLLDRLAKSDEFRFDMAFEPGDIQILNNYLALHSRTEYEDFDEPERKRHLLRMWLQVPQGRKLAPELRRPYGESSPFPSREQAMERAGLAIA